MTKKDLDRFIKSSLTKVVNNCSKEETSKNGKLCYTITTSSNGETPGVNYKEPEYMCYKHNNEKLARYDDVASDWMCETNVIQINWNCSCVYKDKLISELQDFYENQNKWVSLSIEEAVISDVKTRAIYHAEESGISKISDTLEGRVLSGD